MSDVGYLAGDSSFWRYAVPAPKGIKLSLLTKGGVQVVGVWEDDLYVAWAPLIKRNKESEKRLGLVL